MPHQKLYYHKLHTTHSNNSLADTHKENMINGTSQTRSDGGAENAGVEKAGVEKSGADRKAGKCGSRKIGSRSQGWKMQEWKSRER